MLEPFFLLFSSLLLLLLRPFDDRLAALLRWVFLPPARTEEKRSKKKNFHFIPLLLALPHFGHFYTQSRRPGYFAATTDASCHIRGGCPFPVPQSDHKTRLFFSGALNTSRREPRWERESLATSSQHTGHTTAAQQKGHKQASKQHTHTTPRAREKRTTKMMHPFRTESQPNPIRFYRRFHTETLPHRTDRTLHGKNAKI